MEKDKIIASYELLIIGGSAGSLDVLLKVLPDLSASLNVCIVLVLHRKNSPDSMLSDLLGAHTVLPVKEIEDKQPLRGGHIYVAPPDYHLLFEKNKIISLDYSEKVNYSRPSIDVAFESASEAFGTSLCCLLLSGANSDGIAGLKLVKGCGGKVAVQDPKSADTPFMPEQAIANVAVDVILSPSEMAAFISTL
jgi:two-component system chemotaxis response regulator CheB